MTILVETNQATFKRINSGELTMIVHKFNKPVEVGDTLIFQELDGEQDHTGEELKFSISQIETDGCKAGFSAVAFKERNIGNN